MKPNYYLCPICGKHKFSENGDYDICKYCGWENDQSMNDDPSYSGGANDLCQIDFRLRYEYYIKQNPKYIWKVDAFPEIAQIESMWCPICNKFHFEPMDITEIYCGKQPSDVFCRHCGWHYDINQAENHNLKSGANEMSVNEYKLWYKHKLEENPDYDYSEENEPEPVPHKCPVCGKYEFEDEGSYDICPYCGWEDDDIQLDDPDYSGGANAMSLNEYRKDYNEKIALNPKYKWKKIITIFESK